MDFLKNIFRRKEKLVTLPVANTVEWNKKNRFELHTFLKTDTGRALQQTLEQDVLFTQVMACRPMGDMGLKIPINAAERFALAYGKEELLSKFNGLSKMIEEKQDFDMDDEDLKAIIHNRINGRRDEEVVL